MMMEITLLIFVMVFILIAYTIDYLFVSKPMLVNKQVQLAKNMNFERLFILKNSNYIYSRIREVEFSRKILFWDELGVDTTYFALEILNKLEADIPKEKRDKVEKFILESVYNEIDGGFKQTESIPYSTVHATHCAIGALKQLYFAYDDKNKIANNRPVGIKNLQEILSEKKVERIFTFLKNCESDTGGFRESYNEKKISTVNDTATALWIYWHMGRVDQQNSEKTISFIKKCFRYIDDSKCGFTNTVNSNNNRVWICTTYYANRLAIYFDEIKRFIEGHEDCLEEFIISCARKRRSGFAADNRLEPNVIHTKDALSLLIRQWKVHERASEEKNQELINIIEGVKNFMGQCYLNGGYAFAEHKYYMPNIYATRLALDIVEYIDIFRRFNNKNIESLNIEREKIIDFVWSCYDEKVGAFRGYRKFAEVAEVA